MQQQDNKKKRKKQWQHAGWTFDFVIVAAVVLLVLGWQVYSAFSVTYETTPAVQVTVNDSIMAEGWFFRDEIPVTGSTGNRSSILYTVASAYSRMQRLRSFILMKMRWH